MMPEITWWGDSLSASGHGAQRIRTRTGCVVHNAGVGGDTSDSLCARSNAIPALIEVRTGVIPGDGVAPVVPRSGLTGRSMPILLQGTGVPTGNRRLAGRLASVPGRLELTSRAPDAVLYVPDEHDAYGFRRDEPGEVVVVPQPVPFECSFGVRRRGDHHIVWSGNNDPDAATMLTCLDAFARWADRPVVVLGPLAGPAATPATEALMTRRRGDTFLDARDYLRHRCLSDLGIAPTKGDRRAMAEGLIPPSLLLDHVHLTPQTQAALVDFLVLPRLRSLGWFDGD